MPPIRPIRRSSWSSTIIPHTSTETKAWLADQQVGRFEFTFTPKHGSWLNLVEGFFSKLGRSVLRHIRVASKQELKDRIMAAMDEFNRYPVVHTWSYKLDQAWYDSNFEIDELVPEQAAPPASTLVQVPASRQRLHDRSGSVRDPAAAGGSVKTKCYGWSRA
jgi:hypothetical protein